METQFMFRNIFFRKSCSFWENAKK